MPAPRSIVEWIRQEYPKPTVDPAWLDACLEWISEELHLNDINTQIDEIISNVDTQLLNSDLHDSMLAGTGLPRDIATAENTRLPGKILVQIQGMTEIGHSAFSLQNVQQTRIDRADLAGLTGNGEEEDGPIPRYPRSMLRFDLSDGSQSVGAIEFRRLSELKLGVTPLGYKMILKDVPIRRGIAFLEPSNVELKGYMTEELDANRDAEFARGLRMRLGHPEPEPEGLPANSDDLPGDRPLPPPLPELSAGPVNPVLRAPLREVLVGDLRPGRRPVILTREVVELPSRRRVPASSSAALVSATQSIVSPYFSDPAASSATLVSSSDLASVRLSPVHRAPLPSDRPTRETNAHTDVFDFSDDLQVDDAFLQELEAAEQAAITTLQQHSRDIGQASDLIGAGREATVEHSEVIIIDSDSDDKENLAPVVQRRVRRRLTSPEDDDSDVIVVE